MFLLDTIISLTLTGRQNLWPMLFWQYFLLHKLNYDFWFRSTFSTQKISSFFFAMHQFIHYYFLLQQIAFWNLWLWTQSILIITFRLISYLFHLIFYPPKQIFFSYSLICLTSYKSIFCIHFIYNYVQSIHWILMRLFVIQIKSQNCWTMFSIGIFRRLFGDNRWRLIEFWVNFIFV